MAYTVKGHPYGKGDVSSPSITGTPKLHVIGPPALGAAGTQGRYIVQTLGSELRWVKDEPCVGASPTTWTALS